MKISGSSKHIKTLAKIAFIGLSLTYVLWQCDWNKLLLMVKQMSYTHVIFAFIMLHIAQIISSFRMRLYFSSKKLKLTYRKSALLYYVGMLYNTILPGGIGGDGYKVWFLHKHYDFPASESFRVILAERASGLLILLSLLYLMLPFTPFIDELPFGNYLVPLAFIVTFVGYWTSTRVVTREPLAATISAAMLSLLIQLFTLVSVMFLMHGLGIENYLDYSVLFIIAAVASIIPITVGGIGLRELVFFNAAPIMGVAAEQGIGFSLLYFVLYVLVALAGLPAIGLLKKQNSSAVNI